MHRRNKFEILVVGGTGEIIVDFCGLDNPLILQGEKFMSIRGIGLISPTDMPHYDLLALDDDEHLIAYGNDITIQTAHLECGVQLDGTVRLIISGAVDDGIYKVKFQK